MNGHGPDYIDHAVRIRDEAEAERVSLRDQVSDLDDAGQRSFIRNLMIETHVACKALGKRLDVGEANVKNMHTVLFVGDPVTKTPSVFKWLVDQRTALGWIVSIAAASITVLGVLPYVLPYLMPLFGK